MSEENKVKVKAMKQILGTIIKQAILELIRELIGWSPMPRRSRDKIRENDGEQPATKDGPNAPDDDISQ